MEGKRKKTATVKRYENTSDSYFDVAEIEEIAEYYLDNGKYAEALQAVNAGLRLHGEEPSLNWLRLSMLTDDGNFKQVITESRKLFDNIKKAGNDDMNNSAMLMIAEALYGTGRKSEAEDIFSKVLHKKNGRNLDVYLEISRIYENNDELDRALPIIEQALSEYPDELDVLEDAAYVYGHTGQFDKEAECLEKALDQEPYNAANWLSLGKSYLLGQKYEKSVEALKFACSIEPGDVLSLSLLGAAYTRMGNDLLAAECFLKAGECDHSLSEDNLMAAADCYLRMQEYEKAAGYYYQIINDNGPSEDIVHCLFLCLCKSGRLQECLFFLKKIVADYPDNYAFRMLLGDLYCIELHREEDGLPQYMQALRIREHDAEASLSAATAYLEIRQPEKALDLCKDLEQHFPETPNLNLFEAVVYYSLDDYDNVLESLRRNMENGEEYTVDRFLSACPNAADLVKEWGLKP